MQFNAIILEIGIIMYEKGQKHPKASRLVKSLLIVPLSMFLFILRRL